RTISSVISGTGVVFQERSNTVTLSGVNTYSGGTSIVNGGIIATNAASLGTGNVTFIDGQLISPKTTGVNAISNAGNVTEMLQQDQIEAAHGTTLAFRPATLKLDGGTLVFGGNGNDGTINFGAGTVTHTGTENVIINQGLVKAIGNTSAFGLGTM